jgi:septal ring factor EnvC (AmiA/AmiB activator)
MVVSEDVVRQVKRKFEHQFAELVGQIQEHWDKQASLRTRISELENELGHANSRT